MKLVSRYNDNAANVKKKPSLQETWPAAIRAQSQNHHLRMALKLKAPKRGTTTRKTTVREQKVVALKRPLPFTLKVPVNIARTLMCTGNVLNAFGTITTGFVLYAITRFPWVEIT